MSGESTQLDKPHSASTEKAEANSHLLAELQPNRLPGPADGESLKNPRESSGVAIKHKVIEFASSITAGIAGAVVWGATTAETGGLGRAFSLGLAASAGGTTKFLVKDGLEKALLKPEDRTVTKDDFAWGAVDGASGVFASVTERELAGTATRSLGRLSLGTQIADSVAQLGGQKVLQQSVTARLVMNTARGLAGGAVGSFAWGVPHSIADQWQLLKTNPASGAAAVEKELSSTVLLGTATGGAFGFGGTLLANSPEIAGRGVSALKTESDVARVNLTHFNDLHSELTGPNSLPRIATRLSDLRAQSTAQGIGHLSVFAGDLESGNVIFSFTKGGAIENEALGRIGVDAVIPGNHPYDIAGGGSDVDRYVKVMADVKSRHDMPLLAANLDLSSYPDYAGLVKPYVIKEVPAANGARQKVGILGLVTEEGAVNDIKFQDPETVATKYIDELHRQGVDKIVVLSHMGLAEDVKLARQVKGISAIIGGHSHDFEPVPRWVQQSSTENNFWNRLRGGGDKYAGWNVPIVQAGSNGRWLGELNLALKPTGAADRFLTSGRLHPITSAVKPDAELEQYISDSLSDLNRLKSIQYDSHATASYSLRDIRSRETALGNLVADSIMQAAKDELGAGAPEVVLAHSGGIRAGLKANEPISHYDLSNVFMNSGNPDQEKNELVLIANITGKNLKEILEYGVHDLEGPTTAGNPALKNTVSLFHQIKPSAYADEPGNLLQVSGLKYSFDLSKQPDMPGMNTPGRVRDVMIKNAHGEYEPLDNDKVYKVATFYHPLAKWVRHGIFGEGVSFQEAQGRLGAISFLHSPVDVLGKYIQGQVLDPGRIGAVEGRITDLTPKPLEPTVRPGLSLVSYSAIAAEEAGNGKTKGQ